MQHLAQFMDDNVGPKFLVIQSRAIRSFVARQKMGVEEVSERPVTHIV
jgi:hypothetical protein